MSFTRSLAVEALADGENWIVLRSFAWVEDGVEIYVPCGFWTDFGSIPSAFCLLAGHPDDDAIAFVLHDYCYKHAPNGMTRAEADALLDRALKWCGANWFRRKAILAGLRLGGWKVWNYYRKRDKVIEPDP